MTVPETEPTTASPRLRRWPVWLVVGVCLAILLLAGWAVVDLPVVIVDFQGGAVLVGKDRLDAIATARQSLLFFLGGLIAVVTIVLTWRRDQTNRQLVVSQLIREEYDRERAALDRDANRTGRFSEAIKLLNTEDAAIRMGAIYALERIATDSPRDRQTIADILSLYIRTHSPYNPIEPPDYEPNPNAPLLEVPRDVLVCAASIAEISKLEGARLRPLDLRDVDLRRAQFAGAVLNEADFSRSNLSSANFSGAELRAANFYRATLGSTDFSNADLSRADIIEPDRKSQNSKFVGAVLTGTRFIDETLINPDFSDSKIDSVHFALGMNHGVFRRAAIHESFFEYAQGIDFTDAEWKPPNYIAKQSIDDGTKGLDGVSFSEEGQFREKQQRD